MTENAEHPFDRPDADIILRSQDNVDFRTFKLILSLTSDVFSTMFSLPQPPHPNHPSDEGLADGLPVIPIDTPSSALRTLLLYCHPGFETLHCNALRQVQSLAIKYEMLGVARRICKDRIWQERELPPQIMLDTIKRRVGGNESLYLAAVITVLSDDEAEDVVDLDLAIQSQYDSLKRYRDECREAAQAIVFPNHNHYKWMPHNSVEFIWLKEGEPHQHSCQLGGTIYIRDERGKWMTRRWWMTYIASSDASATKATWWVNSDE